MIDEIVIGRFATPLGQFGAALTLKGLALMTYPDASADEIELWARRWAPKARRVEDAQRIARLGEQMSAYFAGSLRQFDVPLDMQGTPFQLQVWRALQNIGYGETSSYGRLAAAIGRPDASRAVGAANGSNPVPIIVPCHRVIGSDGKLVGYGGGIELKRRLLELEGVLAPLSVV